MYDKNTLLNLSSHHTVKAVQLIYRLIKGQVQYERCRNLYVITNMEMK